LGIAEETAASPRHPLARGGISDVPVAGGIAAMIGWKIVDAWKALSR